MKTMSHARPTGEMALKEICGYVAAVNVAELLGPNYPEPGEFVGRRLKDHERIRPVGDYIHGVYVSPTDPCHMHPDGPGWHGSRVKSECSTADVVAVLVSQYLTNCPVVGYGPTVATALESLKSRWGTVEAARASLASAGWGPARAGSYPTQGSMAESYDDQ